jgi:hypothetical protein
MHAPAVFSNYVLEEKRMLWLLRDLMATICFVRGVGCIMNEYIIPSPENTLN